MLESTGRVVLVGTLAATARRPSWSCSRVIVNFMPILWPSELIYLHLYTKTTDIIDNLAVVVGVMEIWTNRVTPSPGSC
jgi:hypothetical protein